MRFFKNTTPGKIMFVLTFQILVVLSTVIPQAEGSDTLFLELKDTYNISSLGANPDVSVTESGEVYVASPSESGLMILNRERKFFVPVEIDGLEEGYFFNPSSVEADVEGRLWIANPDMHEILVRDAGGNLISRFGKGDMALERPEFLFPMAEGKIGAWDSRLKTLSVFFLSESRVIMKQVAAAGRLTCLQDGLGDAICLDSDNGRLIKFGDDGKASKVFLFAEKGNPYPKINHMEIGPGNYLYVTDSGTKQFRYFSSDLKPVGRFLIQERLFIRPTRFTFRNNELWLIDEGRMELIHFIVRTAGTGIEHALLGEEYLALGYFKSALREIETAKAMGIRSPEANMISGRARYGLGRYDEALTDFMRAKDKGDFSVYFYMGNTLFRLRRYAEAETAFSVALEIKRFRELALFNLAQTFMARSRFKDAEGVFTRLLSENPDHLQGRSGLARCFMKQEHFEKASEILIPLENEKGIGRIARHDLGICYLMSGRQEKAVALLKRSAEEGPFYKEAFEGLEKAYRMTGDAAMADRYRKKAEALRRNQLFTPYLLEDSGL